MSISFYAGKYTDTKTIDWVFTREEMTERFYKPFDVDPYDEGTLNPKYRPELDINLSNRDARIVCEALSIEYDEGFITPIDEFIGRCTSFLQKHIGKKTLGFDLSVIDTLTGPTFIDFGIDDGYVERQVHRIVIMAREGKTRGAEVIYGA